MLVGVKILMRDEVVDIQARAVQSTLELHGKSIKECRIGKYIQLDIDTDSTEKALAQAKDIADFVLCNPLTEKFSLEIL